MSPSWGDEEAEEEADIAEEYGPENAEEEVASAGGGWRRWGFGFRLPRFWGAQAIESADEKAEAKDDD